MNNTATTTMDTRSERMLELLAEGASARVIAKKLGYSEGTMRVYLHNLYRAIGVRNKTEAVIWHLHRKPSGAEPALPQPAAMPVAEPTVPAGGSCGDLAIAEDLFTAMGAMGLFVGPYGHVWEAGLRLKGTPIDEKLMAQRAQSRLLWRALLKGDFAYGKLLHDEGHAERVATQSPADAATVACLLSLGGYSGAAQRLVASLGDRRKGNAALGGREMALMRAVGEAMEGRTESSIDALHELAAEGGRVPALKQLAMAALYHVYRSRKHNDAARRTADALWAEAETARQQLEAMGVRPLAREAALPSVHAPRESTVASRRTALAR
jgi:DNA-binding CsgD family transcriptional regulator